MKLKALIIESTGYYRNLLSKILSDMGVECDAYINGKEALETGDKFEYAFILVSRHIEDMSAEMFMYRYRKENFIGNALTVMITSDDVAAVSLEAITAGYELVFDKKDVDAIQSFLLNAVNSRTLDLKAQVLYVEDQKSVAAATTGLFEKYKTHIEHVANLTDFEVKFTSNDYDLVITDYYLNENETGGDVINYVRDFNDVDKARTPILVVSSESDQTKRTLFLRNGANDFIIKPYDNEELIVRSSNLIENKKIFVQAKQQQIKLMKLAMTDQLTGLYNRHSLFDLGPKYLSDARRHKFPVSILVIDLDHFKNVNDTHGHAVGDIVLKAIGKVLNDHCRTEDLVARFGGEEFVMLLSHCAVDAAGNKAESIRQAIEKSKPNNLTIATSIGVAEFTDSDDFEKLFDKADRAVYEAKESGRNRVVIYQAN